VTAPAVIERHARGIPAEGDGGLYSQTWYPICLSAELTPGKILGRKFLGGRVIVFRGGDDEPAVLSAYCAHLGVDLACAAIVEGLVRCPYHHFHYDTSGKAVKIGNGEPPPAMARLFKFPTIERYGLVYAFNGEKALFDAPRFSLPDAELYVHAYSVETIFHVDPFVIISQTPDLNHTQFLHGPQFAPTFDLPVMQFTEFGCGYSIDTDLEFDSTGTFSDLEARIYGTNIVQLETLIGGMWTGAIASLVSEAPGRCRTFGINAVRRADVRSQTDAAMQAVLDKLKAMNHQIMKEDQSVYDNIRFVQGTMLQADRELSRYLDYVRGFPRANPARQFISGEGSLVA
jgi:nitrite reductase/ring-hydroxylating ferredoxin subunit